MTRSAPGLLVARLLSCVILDLDGTVADNTDMILEVYQDVLQRHLGRGFSPQDILSLFGPPEGAIMKQLIPPEKIEDAFEDFYRTYTAKHPNTAFIDRKKLLQIKSWGLRLGLFSGKGRRAAEITLSKIRLQGIFDVVVTGEDVSRSKPDPEGLHLALRRLETSPAQALFVGDSPLDIKAGRAAEVKTGAAIWGTKQEQALLDSAPDHVFFTVPDLMEHLKSHST